MNAVDKILPVVTAVAPVALATAVIAGIGYITIFVIAVRTEDTVLRTKAMPCGIIARVSLTAAVISYLILFIKG